MADNTQQKPGPQQPKPPPEDKQRSGEDVVYRPGEGDPSKVRWRNTEFLANVPTRVEDAELIEAARGNRFFQVGNEKQAENPNKEPTSAMEYRGHVVTWLKGVENVDQLVTRWSKERVLRQKCEVGEDDVRWLGSLIEPKLLAMRKSEGLSDTQVADVWVKHGVLEIPWRT